MEQNNDSTNAAALNLKGAKANSYDVIVIGSGISVGCARTWLLSQERLILQLMN